MSPATPHTVGSLHTHFIQHLTDARVDEAAAKAGWWLAEQLHTSPPQLAGLADVPLSPELQAAWPGALTRLSRHEPLAHVLGHVPFLDLSLLSDKRALIPRPETEELVSLLLADTAWWDTRPRTVVDVGTGSGCIALALAHARPEARITGIDFHADALALARENRDRCGLPQVGFQEGDLLRDWKDGPLDLVVANLPYISRDDCTRLSREVTEYDPRTALDGGEDGLDLIRRLIPQARALSQGGSRLALEIGDEQGDSALSLVRTAYGPGTHLRKDFFGKPRFVFASC